MYSVLLCRAKRRVYRGGMHLGLHAAGLVLGGILAATACSGSSETKGGTGGATASGGSAGTTTGGAGGASGKGGSAGKGGNAGKGGSAGTSGTTGGNGGSSGSDSGEAGEGSGGGASGSGGAGEAGAGSADGGSGGIPPRCELTTELIGSCLLPAVAGATACNEYFDDYVYTEELILGICEPNGGVYSTGPCPDTSLEGRDLLGCCSTVGGYNRNCYYGSESDRPMYELVCETSGCPLLAE